MAAADIGAGNSRYTGNAGIGGGSFGSFQLDTKPIEDLARYTMLYNKSEYDQRQKDVEAAAKEIADYTSYDLTSGIPKDAKHLQEKYDKLLRYAAENPGATDYRNKEQWAKFKEMRNDLENDLIGGKTRNTLFALRQKEIQEQPDPALKKIMQDELDAEIAATDIRTPLKHTQQYKDQSIKLPDAPELTFDVTKVGPNAVVQRNVSVFNVPRARANGDVFALGLEEAIDPSTPEGKRAELGRKNNFWLQGAEAFNSVINAKDEAGNFLYKKAVTDATGAVVSYELDESKMSKLPRNILSLVKETNAYISETKADIKAGNLLDKFEKPITFGAGALDENDYAEINFQDGISPEELALVAQYAKWKGDTYSTKVQQTDNAIQIRGQNITDRHNRATEGIAWGNLKLEQDKWKTSMSGGETVKNGAMERAKRIYSDMEKLTDANGVISPEKVRQLNVEQLKYLGIESPEERDAEGKSVAARGLKPLNAKGEVAIQLIGGAIKVLRPKEDGENAKIEKTADGRYMGLFDNASSTNVFNMATNILNEELKTAGAKELNSYMAIDLGTGGVTTNVVGGGATTSGSTVDKSAIKTTTKKGLPVFKTNDR